MESLRDSFNKHLTNNVIIRIDYVPIPDDKVDVINNEFAKLFLLDNDYFSDTKQTFIRNIDIQMNDPSIQDINEFLNVKEKSKVKSYEYYKYDENKNILMKFVFNRQFCAIDVNQAIKYYKFEDYEEIFLKALDILSTNSIIISRFGLRKFNDFFLKEDTQIGDYVKDKYFNADCNDLLENSDNFVAEKRYAFASEDVNVNLITHSSTGMMDNVLVKRIAFDIDIYQTDVKTLKVLFLDNKKEFIDRENELFFKLYLNLLNERMIKMLKDDEEIDNNIVCGVEYNESN